MKTRDLSVKIANKNICSALNLEISPGDIWGILGPNGCGKTTFLHTLAGLIPATYGEIFLGENNLTTLPRKIIARHLGVLFQDTAIIFPQTVFEFCLQGRYPHWGYLGWETLDDKEIVIDALNKMDLGSQLNQKTHTLSGGEKRRLAISTLLAQTPRLYLLDEPTNHLDLRHQIKTLTYLKTLAKENSASIVMALHDINLVRHFCNKILMLFGDGKAMVGPASELLTTSHLSNLYQVSLQKLDYFSGQAWIPVFD